MLATGLQIVMIVSSCDLIPKRSVTNHWYTTQWTKLLQAVLSLEYWCFGKHNEKLQLLCAFKFCFSETLVTSEDIQVNHLKQLWKMIPSKSRNQQAIQSAKKIPVWCLQGIKSKSFAKKLAHDLQGVNLKVLYVDVLSDLGKVHIHNGMTDVDAPFYFYICQMKFFTTLIEYNI